MDDKLFWPEPGESVENSDDDFKTEFTLARNSTDNPATDPTITESTIGGEEVVDDGEEADDKEDEAWGLRANDVEDGQACEDGTSAASTLSTIVDKAINRAIENIPHSECSYVFIVDYRQSMKMPVYNQEQPGYSYYYSPLSVYNLGVVNHAYKYGVSDGKVEYKEHMHA